MVTVTVVVNVGLGVQQSWKLPAARGRGLSVSLGALFPRASGVSVTGLFVGDEFMRLSK